MFMARLLSRQTLVGTPPSLPAIRSRRRYPIRHSSLRKSAAFARKKGRGCESLKDTFPSIRHDQTGFGALTDLNAATKNAMFEDIEIDLTGATWFAVYID